MAAPVIVVTGANRGIGLEIARQLAKRGALVVPTARSAGAGEAATAKLARDGVAVRFHPLDVVDEASRVALRDFLATTFGRCDVLINNAGIIAEHDDNIATLSLDTVRTSFETNSFAPLRLSQVFMPLLRKSPHGRIVNVSSGAGEVGDFDPSWAPAYCVSKAVLNLFTRAFAPVAAGDGIAVNAFCPGWVRTDMGGANATDDVSQGADTAVWLALDAPQNLTGKFFRHRKEIPW